jgi:hypothetical protein
VVMAEPMRAISLGLSLYDIKDEFCSQRES